MLTMTSPLGPHNGHFATDAADQALGEQPPIRRSAFGSVQLLASVSAAQLQHDSRGNLRFHYGATDSSGTLQHASGGRSLDDPSMSVCNKKNCQAAV
jgi:hypothetical protein